MELTDKLVAKIGTDKLLHLAFGGWFVALFMTLNFWAGIASFAVLIALSILKEAKLDSKPDWMDAVWAFGGGCLSLLFGLVRYLWL